MMNKNTSIAAIGSAIVAIVATGAISIGGVANAQDTRNRAPSFTTLDHPSKPCRLSVEAVANWGETSAHLPQACTFD